MTTTATAVITPRQAWRVSRAPLAFAVALVAIATLVTVSTGTASIERLDPDGARPDGARAIAALLRGRDVTVERRATVAATAISNTLFIPRPELLGAAEWRALRRQLPGRAIVVAEPDRDVLRALELPVDARDGDAVAARLPDCALAAARVAGDADLGGVTFRSTPADATACYPAGGSPTLLQLRHRGSEIVLLGSADFLTNKRLARHGNAALALGLLGTRPGVDWLLPRPGEVAPEPGETQSLADVIPDRVWFALLQVLVAVALLGIWRARRLGPVVTEQLPVVVRAAETVEGRARLYRAARARGRAAAALRAACVAKWQASLGLARTAPTEATVAATAERAHLTPSIVQDLLYGPDPASDAALVALAAALDDLDRRVRDT
ncbi:MAG: hypothetical protein LC640_02055 [Frankia sp.]|nr:hypothetical protein [Frankia sp.]